MELTVDNKTFFIPGKDSPCDQWKQYYSQLRSAVGSRHAKTIWLLTWKHNGTISCMTNAAFNRWMEKHGITVSNAATKAIADVSSIGDHMLGLGKNLTGILSYGIPILIGGVVVTLLILLYNTAKKGDVSTLAMLSPAGRAAVLGTIKQQAG